MKGREKHLAFVTIAPLLHRNRGDGDTEDMGDPKVNCRDRCDAGCLTHLML